MRLKISFLFVFIIIIFTILSGCSIWYAIFGDPIEGNYSSIIQNDEGQSPYQLKIEATLSSNSSYSFIFYLKADQNSDFVPFQKFTGTYTVNLSSKVITFTPSKYYEWDSNANDWVDKTDTANLNTSKAQYSFNSDYTELTLIIDANNDGTYDSSAPDLLHSTSTSDQKIILTKQ